jgi:hypothetical protein
MRSRRGLSRCQPPSKFFVSMRSIAFDRGGNKGRKDPGQVIERFVRSGARDGSVRARKSYRALLRALQKTIRGLKPNIRTIAGHGLDPEVAAAILSEAIPALERLKEGEERAPMSWSAYPVAVRSP